MPRRNRDLVIACVLAGALVWLYGGILSSLVRQWASDDNYSHGFFVAPLAAYFAWERRHLLAGAPSRPSIVGLFLVAASLVVLLAGLLGAELFLTRVSLVGVLAGTVLFVWGRDHLRILALPVAFLLLMIPLPAIIFNQIAFPLQLLASRAGELALGVAGIPVLREGNVLQLPSLYARSGGSVQRHSLPGVVAHPCDRSGIFHRAANRGASPDRARRHSHRHFRECGACRRHGLRVRVRKSGRRRGVLSYVLRMVGVCRRLRWPSRRAARDWRPGSGRGFYTGRPTTRG